MRTQENQLEVLTPNDLLLTESPFGAKQLQLFYQETPKDKIMARPAKGGGTWEYVQSGYVIETLNRIFGYMWSFNVLTSLTEAAQIASSGSCVVLGRLTVHVGDKTLVKEQFGRCEVKFKTEYDPETRKKVRTNEFLDFGNDMKGAATDALKKCASELGLFRDIYHKDDFEALAITSEEEKAKILAKEAEMAKKLLQAASDVEELKAIWVSLTPSARLDKTVAKCKDDLKRKFSTEGEVNESSTTTTK